ncbi:methyl-accepting chemotaxis protein [Brevibacillus sp. B_LB10_24]|uniref:methyl-accepting chemotaxis protein n=1 Tax=Brevibacillus sp. B_LB10_24 TaxID=3380645 RepID=UPI0038B99461
MFRLGSRLSFFGKNLILSTLTILLMGIVLTLTSYFIQKAFLLENLDQQARGFASYAKGGLKLDDVKQALIQHEKSAPVQKQLTQQLDRMSKENPNIAQGYIFGAEMTNGNTNLTVAVPTDVQEAGYSPGDMFEQADKWVAAYQRLMSSKEAVNTGVYTDSYGTWMTILEPIMDDNGQVIAIFGVDTDASIIAKGTNQLLLWLAAVLILSFIGIFVIQFVALRRFLSPLQHVFDAISQMSEGRLDLELKVDSQDELGVLSQKVNGLLSQWRTIIRRVQQYAEHAAASASELSVTAEQNTASINQMTNAIQEVAGGTTTQAQSAEENAKAMDEMAIGIQRIAEASSNVAESSADMAEKAQQGYNSINKVVGQIDAISRAVNSSSLVVTTLDERSQEIGKIVDVISEIASQTNLLALNAAIEAARAGEQGKGFAVVADEVRKLAEQSARSTAQITSLIVETQQDTAKAVQTMQEGTREVEVGIHVANEAGLAFQHILQATQDVADQVQEVSAISQQMSAGSEEVSATVQELASIAKESAANISAVASSAEEQLASTQMIAESVQTLNQMAHELQTIVGKFKA